MSKNSAVSLEVPDNFHEPLAELAREGARRMLCRMSELGKVVEGVQFKDGIEVKQPNDQMAA